MTKDKSEKEDNLFKIQNKLVLEVYNNHDNYLIENGDLNSDYSVIYFSGNSLYYPSNESNFKEAVINKNRFGWRKNKIINAKKHIFIRDVFKQWYIKGINAKLNSIDKLLSFLKDQTKGTKIILIGCSSGGYAASLFGSLLKADYVFAFSAQFSLFSQMSTNVKINENPLVFRYKDDEQFNKYYDLIKIIKNSKVPIFYFSSQYPEDSEQRELVRNIQNIFVFEFNSSGHGIPFLLSALKGVLNASKKELIAYHNLYFNNKINYLKFSADFSDKFSTINNIVEILEDNKD